MREFLSLKNLDIDGAFRLNSKDKSKPKPLVIILKDKEAWNRFLQAAKNLKDSTDH